MVMSARKGIRSPGQFQVELEDAAQQAVKEASRTLDDLKSIYIKDHSAVIENGHIVEYRIDAKLTFSCTIAR